MATKKTTAKKSAAKSAPSKPSAEKRILGALELLGSCVQFQTEEQASEFAALVSGKAKATPEGEGPAPATAVVTSSTGQ